MVTSYLQNDYSRQLFLKRRQAIVKQLLNFSLAVVLIFFDMRFHQNPIRQYVGNIVSVVHRMVIEPVNWLNSAHEFVFGQRQLQTHTKELELKVLNLEYQLHQKNLKIYLLDKLKNWLESQDSQLEFAGAANLILIQVTPNRQIYVIDQGRKQGIFEGQIAIDGHGVIGQIIDVGLNTSTLMLISDSRCAVPIINKRTGSHGVLVGENNQNVLKLLHVPKTEPVEPGDLLMTSGLGKIYPFGIPVGIVGSVTTNPGDDFLTVKVRPLAKLNKHHMIILLKPFEDIAKWQKELAQRVKLLEAIE